MKNCQVCRFCEMRPERHFEDCEKKTIFGMVPSEGEDPFCLAFPEPVNIKSRRNVPCSFFESGHARLSILVLLSSMMGWMIDRARAG